MRRPCCRRYTNRKGPLIVYDQDQGISKAFRNLPGVDVLPVTALNLLHVWPQLRLGAVQPAVSWQAVQMLLAAGQGYQLYSTIACAEHSRCGCSWHQEATWDASSSGRREPLRAWMRSLVSSAASHVDAMPACACRCGLHKLLVRLCLTRLPPCAGTFDEASAQKKGFSLPRPQMTNADLARLINSDEVPASFLSPRAALQCMLAHEQLLA